MLLFPSLHCPISLWMFSSLYCAPTSLFNSSPATILPTKIHLELSSAGIRPLDFTMPSIHNSKYSTYTVLARIMPVPLEGKRCRRSSSLFSHRNVDSKITTAKTNSVRSTRHHNEYPTKLAERTRMAKRASSSLSPPQKRKDSQRLELMAAHLTGQRPCKGPRGAHDTTPHLCTT